MEACFVSFIGVAQEADEGSFSLVEMDRVEARVNHVDELRRGHTGGLGVPAVELFSPIIRCLSSLGSSLGSADNGAIVIHVSAPASDHVPSPNVLRNLTVNLIGVLRPAFNSWIEPFSLCLDSGLLLRRRGIEVLLHKIIE